MSARGVRLKWPAGLAVAGITRPARPVTVFAEDFSEMLRGKVHRRLRYARGRWRMLH